MHRLLLLVIIFTVQVHGHGRLVEPPSRASAWRYGFNTPKNFNDNELYCGGWSRQHQKNNGQCGVCGDPWDLVSPRPNEYGGHYGKGVIVKTYKKDSTIEVGVELTANHQGYFEFRLCPHNFQKISETEHCFEQNLLQQVDGSGPRYYPGPGSGIIFKSNYSLPAGVTCTQCVLQWIYVAGNNWGMCSNGTGHVGCGPQEQFRACSDIRISEEGEVETRTTNAMLPTITPRTRGTVTSRFTRPTTTTTTTTKATTAEEATPPPSTTPTSPLPAPPHDAFGAGGAQPGHYAGIIIALSTLLFAMFFISCIVLYFYRGHEKLKGFLNRHLRSAAARSSDRKKTLKLPSSILTAHTPQLTLDDIKPPTSAPSVKPEAPSVRHLALTISEPIDVTINGVAVLRNNSQAGHNPTA